VQSGLILGDLPLLPPCVPMMELGGRVTPAFKPGSASGWKVELAWNPKVTPENHPGAPARGFPQDFEGFEGFGGDRGDFQGD